MNVVFRMVDILFTVNKLQKENVVHYFSLEPKYNHTFILFGIYFVFDTAVPMAYILLG